MSTFRGEVKSITLPHVIKEPSTHPVEALWHKISPSRITNNISVLSRLAGKALALHDKALLSDSERNLLGDFIVKVSRLREVFSFYEQQLPNAEHAADVSSTLQAHIPSLGRLSSKTQVPLSQMQREIKARLTKTPERILFISDSHLTFAAEATAVHEITGESPAVAFFDAHLDTISGKTHPEKANIVGYTLNNGSISNALVLGVSQHVVKLLQFEPLQSEYAKYADRLSVFPASSPGTLLTPEILQQRKIDIRLGILQFLQRVKRSGTKSVVVSIDIDVIKNLTAMEYSSFATLSLLSVLDFTRLTSRRDLESVLGQVDVVMKTLLQPRDSIFLIDDELTEDELDAITMLPEVQEDLQGLDLKTIIESVAFLKEQAQNLGLDFGLKLPSGGVWLGDIVEAKGPDLDGNTANAIAQLQLAF